MNAPGTGGRKPPERKPDAGAQGAARAPVAPVEPVEPPAAPAPVAVRVRGRHSPGGDRTFTAPTAREALALALDYRDCPAAAPEIEGDGDSVAFVDVDAHGVEKPDTNHLTMLLMSVAADTGAAAYWITHGGGGRLAYVADGGAAGFSASERAALGRFAFTERKRVYGLASSVTGIEVKKTSAHPAYVRKTPDGRTLTCGPANRTGGSQNLRAVAGALVGGACEADPEAVADWIETRGYQFGQRLPHTECPFDPAPAGSDAVASSRAVIVLPGGDGCGPGGLYCHKCGRLMPFTALIDGSGARSVAPDPLRQCVRGMAPFSHARHVLAHRLRLNERDAQALYASLLKLWHLHGPNELDDEQAEAVAVLVRDAAYNNVHLVRVAGGFVSPNTGRPVVAAALEKKLPTLAAARYVQHTGATGSKPRALAALLGDDDVEAAEFGFPPLRPIIGVDFFRQVGRGDDPRDVPFVVTRDGRAPFQYRPESKRTMFLGDTPRGIIERQFPGINYDYLQLCVGGIAFTQRAGATEADRVYVTGISGSAKTTTAELAAELCGVPFVADKLTDNPDRTTRAAAAAAGGILCLDEVAKSGLTGDEFVSRLQGIKRGAGYHALYRGAARLGATPFIVLCDTTVARFVLEDAQLRRRLLYAPLGAGRLAGAEKPDWKRTSGGVGGWRERGPAGYSLPELGADVADGIVSEVIDALAKLDPCATFEDFAATLGFGLVSADTDGVDHNAPFRELFHAVVTAEPTEGDTRFQGKGWVVFEEGGSGSVAAAWRACASSEGFAGPKDQLITGRDWAATTGVDRLECVYAKHGRRVGLKFHVGALRSATTRFHRDVLTAAVEVVGAVEGGAVPTVPTAGAIVPTALPTAKSP